MGPTPASNNPVRALRAPGILSAAALSLLALAGCTSDGGPSGGACVSNRDCASGEVCVAGQCLGDTASGCMTDQDCPLGEYCDTDTNKCAVVQVISCETDQACPPDQRCNTATGVCIDAPRSCTPGAGGCPAGRVCDPASNTCVQCVNDQQCSGGDVCEMGTCVDPNKPSNNANNNGNNTSGCTEDAQCEPPLSVCEAGECVLGCAQPGGLNCSGGAVCDSNTGRCVTIEGPCMSDSECSPPMTVCESGQCIPGCDQTGGLQCQGGQACNPNTGRCQAGGPVCVTDADCNPPTTVCNLFSGVCEPGCGDSGCTAPETCDATSGHCVDGTPCMPDRFEPNESQSAAAMINNGPQAGLTLCETDEDWYAVPLGQGDDVTVTLTFVHGEGDLNLELVDPSGQVVASSNGTSGTEMVSHTAAVAGVHAVRVTMAADTGPKPGNDYTLDINSMVAPCAEDAYEDNDSDFGAALMLPGNYNNLNVCVGDDDYYDVILSAGDRIDVDVQFSHAEGDIDVSLHGLLGLTLATSDSSTDNESVTYTAQNAGFFTVRVQLYQDSGNTPGNPYSINVTVTQAAPPMCPADGLEENDSSGTARVMSPGNQTGLNVCEGDEDFYSFDFAANDDVTVNVAFTDAEGDIDVELLDPAGNRVAQGVSSTDDESFSYQASTAGPHTLRVYLYRDDGGQIGNDYAMNVSVAGSASCTPDPLEPNDSSTSPASVPVGTYNNLSACEGNDDFYAVDLTSGTPVNVQVLFAHAEGDMDMRLYDPAGNEVAASTSVTDDENINYTPVSSGVHLLHVYLYRETGSVPGNTYDLILQ